MPSSHGICYRKGEMMRQLPAIMALVAAIGLASCLQIKAPKDPIVINLNIKIDQEVRLRLEDDVQDLIEDNPDIF